MPPTANKRSITRRQAVIVISSIAIVMVALVSAMVIYNSSKPLPSTPAQEKTTQLIYGPGPRTPLDNQPEKPGPEPTPEQAKLIAKAKERDPSFKPQHVDGIGYAIEKTYGGVYTLELPECEGPYEKCHPQTHGFDKASGTSNQSDYARQTVEVDGEEEYIERIEADLPLPKRFSSNPKCVSSAAKERHMKAVYVYRHGSPDKYSESVNVIRDSVRAANGKFNQESLISSKGTNPLNLRVGCTPDGKIEVKKFFYTPDPNDKNPNSISSVTSALYRSFGDPYQYRDGYAVKYLIFGDLPAPPDAAGYGGGWHDESGATKNKMDNPNWLYTTSALIYRGYWSTMTLPHEIGHTIGAVSFSSPSSDGVAHCFDGLDIMCYLDTKAPYGKYYADAYCHGDDFNPAGWLYRSPEGAPFDCNYDDFFNAGLPGGYLASHWNSGGYENDFVEGRIPPTSTFSAQPSCSNGAMPFYRLNNSIIGDHFYTTSTTEATVADRDLGYNYEGVAGYIFPSSQPGTVALHRLYNYGSRDRLYTTSGGEVDYVKGIGYAHEGVAGYIYPGSTAGTSAFYRLNKVETTDRLYTVSTAEIESAAKIGFKNEGPAGYIFASCPPTPPPPPPDTTPPTITLGYPIHGTTLKGNSSTLNYTTSDNKGVPSVQVTLDGKDMGPANTSPAVDTLNYFYLETNKYYDGRHVINLIAKDAAGNTTKTPDRVVYFNNGINPRCETSCDPPYIPPPNCTERADFSNPCNSIDLLDFSLILSKKGQIDDINKYNLNGTLEGLIDDDDINTLTARWRNLEADNPPCTEEQLESGQLNGCILP